MRKEKGKTEEKGRKEVNSEKAAQLILNQLTEIQEENRHDHEMMRATMVDQGERLVKVETKVTGLIPKVDKACAKANNASNGLAGIKGQWKILLYFLGAGCLGFIGWVLKGVFG